MKIFPLLLLFPLVCLSQTVSERQKIVSSYDIEKVKKIQVDAQNFTAEQKRLIAEYKKANRVEESEKHSLQRIIDGTPIFFTTGNRGSAQTIRTNTLYPGGSMGLNVTGEGIVTGVWDGGKVRNTHIEFSNGRVTLNDPATDLSTHATHVTGTIIAAGISPIRRGIAYGASALTHDWDEDYIEMVAFGSAGYLVSNHSYGYNPDSLPLWRFGAYDSSSAEIDELSNAFPYYQIVIAAGNDRNSGTPQDNINGGYDLLTGASVSKNSLTIAATNEVLNYVDNFSPISGDFSNFGPPDDGRIKPDVAAKGVGVSSTWSTGDGAYESISGTSMAAPAMTGMVALLQKHYNNINAAYMKAAMVRGVICHSTKEAGFYDGPDYEFGWGLADAQKAATIISGKGSTTVLEENTLALNQVFSKEIALSSTQPLTVTICWTDPVGNLNNTGVTNSRTPRLKNNLDLKVLKDGIVYYPWKLNPEEPYSEPTRDSDNNVDNVEKVQIDAAEPGVYTIQVSHKNNLVNGEQPFALIASGQTSLTLAANQYDFENKVILYPNPVKNVLNITAPASSDISFVTIYDILGKQMSSGKLLDHALEVSGLSKGIYFAKIVIDGKSITKKFIKE